MWNRKVAFTAQMSDHKSDRDYSNSYSNSKIDAYSRLSRPSIYKQGVNGMNLDMTARSGRTSAFDMNEDDGSHHANMISGSPTKMGMAHGGARRPSYPDDNETVHANEDRENVFDVAKGTTNLFTPNFDGQNAMKN